MVLVLSPRSIIRALFVTIAVLTALHLLTLVARLGFGHPQVYGFVAMFDTNRENNVPSFFSALNMLLCAVLLGLIAAAERSSGMRTRKGWTLLAVLFVLLPFDELFAVHERLNGPVKAALNTSGAFLFAWVVPYAALTLLSGAVLLRLLASVDPRTRRGMVLSGAVFVSGAIGLEMLGGWIAQHQGMDSLAYAAESTVEELLEMLGIALFTHVLLSHMARSGFRLRVDTAARAANVRDSEEGRATRQGAAKAASTRIAAWPDSGAGEGNRTLV